MYILTIFSMRIEEFNVLGLDLKLSDLRLFLREGLGFRILKILNFLVVLGMNFDSIEQFELILIFPEFVIDGFFQ